MAFTPDTGDGGATFFSGRGGGSGGVLPGDVRSGAPEASAPPSAADGGATIIPNVGSGDLLTLRTQPRGYSGTIASPSEMAQPQSMSALQFTVAAYNAILPIIYGAFPAIGLLANLYASGTNWIFWVIWGRGPLISFNARFFNDGPYPIGTTSNDYLGTDTQTADPILGAIAGFTDPMHGIAYSVITIPQASVTGTPKFTDFIVGRPIYDPRLDSTNGGSGSHRQDDPTTWEQSSNAALIACDYFRSTDYGLGKTPIWSTIVTAANICDDSTFPRQIFMAMDQEQSKAAWAATFLTACNCLLVEQGDTFKLVPDVAGSSLASYSHASGQIIALDGETLSSTAELPTVMEIVFSNATGYPWTEDTVRVERAGVTAGSTPYRKSTVRMPWIADVNDATSEAYQRLNKLWHRQHKFRLTLFDEGLQHEPGDIIDITFPDSGYSALLCKVSSTLPTVDGWELTCAAESASAYNHTAVVP